MNREIFTMPSAQDVPIDTVDAEEIELQESVKGVRNLIREMLSINATVDVQSIRDRVLKLSSGAEDWYIDHYVEKFSQEAQQVADKVEAALVRIPRWLGSPVKVKMDVSDGYEELSATARVYVGSNFFTLFDDGRPEDVLEDEEDFSGPIERADYMRLVSEIKRPGSTSRLGRKVRLYTARPSRDRSRYEGASTVPVGIFLTSSPDDAAGMAAESGNRDVWEVVLSAADVVETMRSGSLQWYQTVGIGEVPVDSIEIV